MLILYMVNMKNLLLVSSVLTEEYPHLHKLSTIETTFCEGCNKKNPLLKISKKRALKKGYRNSSSTVIL